MILFGLRDSIDIDDPCTANPNDPVCQAFRSQAPISVAAVAAIPTDSAEIEFPDDFVGRTPSVKAASGFPWIPIALLGGVSGLLFVFAKTYKRKVRKRA